MCLNFRTSKIIETNGKLIILGVPNTQAHSGIWTEVSKQTLRIQNHAMQESSR